MTLNSKKIFVLDTNVILHDSACIYQFKEHDVVIPMSVLEELDRFKKGNEVLNFHAREFVRSLDDMTGGTLFEEGVEMGPDLGRLMIRLDEKMDANLALNFSNEKADHRILNTAFRLVQLHSKEAITLVTKDVNLRMKAKAIGLISQDYTSDHVENISDMYSGQRIEENIELSLIDQLYAEPFEFDVAELETETPFTPNEFVILRNHKKSALACFDPAADSVRRVDKNGAYSIMPRNAEQTFALDALMNKGIQLVTLTGKAGTGKTLLTLAAALEQNREYAHIFVARPVVPLSNKDIGYLPGDIQSKLNPYMQPLFDNLGVIQNRFPKSDKKSRKIAESLDSGRLTITALSYIRGRSIMKTFFIIDEAQNLTPHEVKTVITRAGEGTKIVLTGDIFQIDHPYLDSHSNGLSYLIEKMRGQKLYAHVNLDKGERSELAELASDLL